MASNYGMLFLNKALQSEDRNVFARYGIEEDTFISDIDKRTYRFITEYEKKNAQLPSYAMVSDAVEGFTYVPSVTDRFSTLADGIKDIRAKVAFNEVFSKEFPKISETYDSTTDVIDALSFKLDEVKRKYTHKESVGKDLKQNVDDYLADYKRRQLGESFKAYDSFLSYVNEYGGYTSGNMYVIYGESGRGKSVIALREVLNLAQQGATVLVWSLEMPTYEVFTRLYSMLSAQLKVTSLTIEGTRYDGGFSTSQLNAGTMDKDFEDKFKEMLHTIQTHVKGTIVVRGVDDYDFDRRDIKQLETDIETTGADVVLVDPMYYMQFERNTSKTAGGDASETSKQLRRLAGTKDIVLFTVTQAEIADERVEKDEIRELKVPTRAAVKKTKSLLEDASTLIAVDTDYTQRRGLVGLQKWRHGGEGTSCEITFLPSFGVVEEIKIDPNMFDF